MTASRFEGAGLTDEPRQKDWVRVAHERWRTIVLRREAAESSSGMGASYGAVGAGMCYF